jgi:predicted esterase
VLNQIQERKDIDRASVYLCGLSQGAAQAFGLLANYPNQYAGAILLSPGAIPALPDKVAARGHSRPMYIVAGEQEHPFTLKTMQVCVELWKGLKWPVWEQTHPGRRQIPEDWDVRFPKVLKWLANPTAIPQETPNK